MRALPLVAAALFAAACATAPSARTAARPAGQTQGAKKAYYLLKGPATVGWVADRPGTWVGVKTSFAGPAHPFRWTSYDAKAEGELATEAVASGSFQDFAERAKKKGYRLVVTKRGP